MKTASRRDSWILDSGPNRMPRSTGVPSPRPTAVLLIEADSNARSRHENVLHTAGYSVLALAVCPDTSNLRQAAVVLSDIPSFDWLQERHIRQLPPMVVLTADEKAGVTACLCGAAAWVPVDSDDAYLLDTLDGLLRRGNMSTTMAGKE